MAEVQLKRICKSYDGLKNVVNHVSFHVRDKEFVVLVGPSGCGKTTVLRMVAGLEEITDGEMYIDDKLVNNIPPSERDIAMVFQNYALYPHMTVFQNMAFGLKVRKMPKGEIKKRVEEAAEILEITHLLDRKPRAMSGGQRQRVAIGRAIVRNPKVFLFDEPLSNLDAKLRVQMRVELQKLHAELQVTMLYVTHDQVEAMTLGDRIVVLKDGEISQIGTPYELYNTPDNLFVAGFIGTPPMNFIEGQIKEVEQDVVFSNSNGDLKLSLGRGRYRIEELLGKNIHLGIRAEDIYLGPNETENLVPVFERKIMALEHTGSDSQLHFETGNSNIILKTKPDHGLNRGEEVMIYFDVSKIQLFDTETGLVIKAEQ
jgi:multiple sugar transport system ATP-binding protein